MEALENSPSRGEKGRKGFGAETWEVSVTQRKMADMPFFIVPLRALKTSSIIHRGHLGQRV